MFAPVRELSGTRRLKPSTVHRGGLPPEIKMYQATSANIPNPSFTSVGEVINNIASNMADIILVQIVH